MYLKAKVTLLTLIAGSILACSDTNIIVPTSPTSVVTNPNNPNNPVPTNPIVSNKIEFRVTGNALGAIIRYSTSNDGIAQVTTVLPFVFGMNVNQSNIFLSLEATPTSYGILTTTPFMAAQIFVNGNLFRETASSSFFIQTIGVSGTWRQ